MSSKAKHKKRLDSGGPSAFENRDEASRPRMEDDDLRSEIAERAYARYLARGAGDGRDLEDWLESEQEVRQRSR